MHMQTNTYAPGPFVDIYTYTPKLIFYVRNSHSFLKQKKSKTSRYFRLECIYIIFHLENMQVQLC